MYKYTIFLHIFASTFQLMNKQEIQTRELQHLMGKKRVCLKWATGMGKSKMAIDLANDATYPFSSAHKAEVLLVVAERSHKQNWIDEMQKWGFALDRVNLTMICYASLHKVRDMSFDVLILDEAHHCFTEKRMEILKSIKPMYVYLLSATLSRQKLNAIEDIYSRFCVSAVSLKTAIDAEALPEPMVNIVNLKLNDSVVNQEIKIGKGDNLPEVTWEQRFPYINGKKTNGCIIKCTERQKYQYYTDSMEYWKRRYEHTQNPYHRNMWVQLGSQRKRFLGELKTKYVERLSKFFNKKSKRYICFCASVLQGEYLNKHRLISSKRRMPANQKIIDSFNNKKIRSIFAVGMATEGLNLKDIQIGVITQLDGKERLFVQKAGRAMRAEYPQIWVFCYENTQDTVYLRNVVNNIEEKYIKSYTLEEFYDYTKQ